MSRTVMIRRTNIALSMGMGLVGNLVGRDTGVQIDGDFEQIAWAIAVQNGADSVADEYLLTGRVSVDIMGEGAGQWVEGAYNAPDGTNLSVGLAFCDDGFYNDGSRIGLEAYLTNGPFAASAEVVDNDTDVGDNTPWDATFSWMFNDMWEAALRWEDRAGALLALEGGHAIRSPEDVSLFAALGVRMIGLTWSISNALCGSSGDAPQPGAGLTPLGQAVVREAGRMGIAIDLAHASDACIEDVLNVSAAPVLASHSNARALFDHYRNLTDAQIAGIVAGGGLIGVTFVNAFLHRPAGEATIEHVLDQIDYLVRTAGSDHVTIGSDFDGATMPAGLEDATRYPALTVGMATRGHSEETIRKVLGLNFLRVFEQVTGR